MALLRVPLVFVDVNSVPSKIIQSNGIRVRLLAAPCVCTPCFALLPKPIPPVNISLSVEFARAGYKCDAAVALHVTVQDGCA